MYKSGCPHYSILLEYILQNPPEGNIVASHTLFSLVTEIKWAFSGKDLHFAVIQQY